MQPLFVNFFCEHLAIAKAKPPAELSVNNPFDFRQMETLMSI